MIPIGGKNVNGALRIARLWRAFVRLDVDNDVEDFGTVFQEERLDGAGDGMAAAPMAAPGPAAIRVALRHWSMS